MLGFTELPPHFPELRDSDGVPWGSSMGVRDQILDHVFHVCI